MSLEDLAIPGIRLLKEIRRGSQSIVYLGQRDQLYVAVKIPRPPDDRVHKSTDILFKKEASILARAKHSALLEVYEVGQVEDMPYLVMEYFDAPTLAQKIEKGPLPETEMLMISKLVVGA